MGQFGLPTVYGLRHLPQTCGLGSWMYVRGTLPGARFMLMLVSSFSNGVGQKHPGHPKRPHADPYASQTRDTGLPHHTRHKPSWRLVFPASPQLRRRTGRGRWWHNSHHAAMVAGSRCCPYTHATSCGDLEFESCRSAGFVADEWCTFVHVLGRVVDDDLRIY